MSLPYRPNVGIALFNAQGLVFAGRSHSAGPEIVLPGFDWQMPQGGIDPDEDIVAAARRELEEETGVIQAELLTVTEDWWSYDFPPYDGPWHKLAAFRGQRQRWAAFRFVGCEDEITVAATHTDQPAEFVEWRWRPLAELPGVAPLHRRAQYARVLAAFGHIGPV